MKQYYCQKCVRDQGLIARIDTNSLNLTGSNYLFEKFEKHTKIPTGTDYISVYNDPTYQNYKGYTISGSLSGFLEIDEKNRKNLIWHAEKYIGVTYDGGNLIFPIDAVKVVLPEDTGRLHSFPVNSNNYSSEFCISCARQILS